MSYLLGKAKESLKSARILFEAECYDNCAKGRYGHAWVHAAVARELIHRRKILPSASARALSAALKLREEADYSDMALGRKRAERLLRHCQEFVDRLQREVLRDVAS